MFYVNSLSLDEPSLILTGPFLSVLLAARRFQGGVTGGLSLPVALSHMSCALLCCCFWWCCCSSRVSLCCVCFFFDHRGEALCSVADRPTVVLENSHTMMLWCFFVAVPPLFAKSILKRTCLGCLRRPISVTGPPGLPCLRLFGSGVY